MAYNLRSRLTSEGSSVAPRSEGMNLSPVELAVLMSEQTRTTAGHGLDLLGPVIIEGSPEALQTVAIPAPITSQIVSDTTAEPDVSLEVADEETDEQTETLNTTIVPTPAMYLAADSTHPASSVCGAGAAGPGPPPSGPGAAPSPFTSRDPSYILLHSVYYEVILQNSFQNDIRKPTCTHFSKQNCSFWLLH